MDKDKGKVHGDLAWKLQILIGYLSPIKIRPGIAAWVLFLFLLQTSQFLPVAVKAEGSAALSESQKALDQARQALCEGQTEESESTLREILQKDGTCLEARQLHAEVLYQLRQYHFALDEAKVVLNDRPKDPDIALLMAKIYQSIHQSARAAQFYKKYLELAKTGDPTYQTLVQILEDQARSEADKHSKARASVGDYLSAVGGIAYARWKNPQAIRVYVKSGHGIEGYRSEFEEALRQAFDDWSEAAEGKIAFVFTANPADAQLSVTWTSDLKAPALKAEAGFCQNHTDADGLSKSDILLLTLDPFKEGPIGTNYLFNICLHEIGHALGLVGHSPYEQDIMSPSLYTQQGLSDRDVNTVLALYSDKSNLESLSNKDEYGRPLSEQVKCDRLVQAGTAAAISGDYNKAIEKLSLALEMNPQIDLARKNLAVAANNLAIAPGISAERKLALLYLALYWQVDNQAARDNLNNELNFQGRDPRSFAVRVALAHQCLSKSDPIGATVEYREALSIKEDKAIRSQLNALESRPIKVSK